MKTFAKRFGIDQWSFIGPGSEKKWYPSENSPQGAWDHVAEDMLLKFAESGHPIFRATTPLSRGQLKSKGKGKVSIHFSADQDTVDTIYRIVLSVNQLSIYGAVAAICDEYEGHPDSTREPVILEGQSIVLGEIKAEVPAHDKELEDAKIIFQKYFQQVKSPSPENRLSKFWETNGQCVKGNNCSFRHDMDKRRKSSPSNPSQNSFMQQSERKPSRTRSPRGKSPSGRMSRWPCKDYLRGTCNNSFCKRWHPPECLFYKNKNGSRFGEKCSFAHRQVDAQPTKMVQIE